MLEKDFMNLLKEKVEEALKQRGRVNVIIAGKTGVGKSTLVNAVFHGEIAETGDGRPVTQSTREYSKDEIPLSIYDTRGLEVGEYENTVRDLEKLIKDKKKSDDPNDHIHIAWICILEDSRRVEEAEIKLVEMLDDHVPVIAVITKSISDNGFRQTVQALLPQARNVVRVHAKETLLDGGLVVPVMGLDKLVDLTMNLVPEAQKNAFVASQRVSLDHKMQRAHAVVAGAALSAGGVGACPLPFADALALVPLQVSMLAGISAVWGLPLSTAFLGTLVSGSITGSGATMLGRATVGALLKFIPGVGSVMGGAISATVAATLTTLFGEAYIAALYGLTKDNPERKLSPEEIRAEFMNQLKLRKNLKGEE